MKYINIANLFLLIGSNLISGIVYEKYGQYGQWHVANDKDAKGNTALHRLACQCDQFSNTKEIYDILNDYKLHSAGHLPNPFIKNNDDLEASDIAFDKVRSHVSNVESCLLIGYLLNYMKEAYSQGVYDAMPGSDSQINHQYWREIEEERIAREIAKE